MKAGKELRRQLKARLKKVSRKSVSEWADEYRQLPLESSEPGQWKTARVPYMREVMDCFTDSRINRIVVKSASQVSKSECLLNIVGRMAQLEPCSIMIIQPTLSDAEDFSKARLSRMIQDTKALTPLFYDKARSRDPNQTILSKFFKGGRVILVGANSSAGLASRPIKILLCDEVDRYPAAIKEGDPIRLAEARTSTFFDKKVALFSTPTIEGLSRIDLEYELGTQEEWQHVCPNCGENHALYWGDMVVDYEAKADAAGNKGVVIKSVRWRCPDCGSEFSESAIKKAAQVYVPKNPEAISNGRRSFWISGFSSPWLSWEGIMREWLEAQGDSSREQVIMNTRFGLSYRYEKRVVEEDALVGRLEDYNGEIPRGVLCLTCGVDVQANRLHYAIYGWGAGFECWGIQYGVIYGAPTQARTWQGLDEVLNRTYQFGDGMGLKIARAFIDSGYATDAVYNYVRGSSTRFAIKGLGAVGVPLLHKYSPQNDKGIILTVLGVNAGKAEVMSRLERMHFGRDDSHLLRNFDLTFFHELTAEQAVLKRSGGRLVEVYETIGKKVRNEALDCTVYALAAMQSLIGMSKHADFWARQAGAIKGEIKKPAKKAARTRTMDIWN